MAQNIDTLLWHCFQEAEQLLRDLEAIEPVSNLASAGQYLNVVMQHIEPLRRVVEAVEEHERRDAQRCADIADGL